MNHKQAAKSHFSDRMVERYGRRPSLKEIDFFRLSLKNRTCFLYKDCGPVIKGIVSFQNIHASVVYDKNLDGMVTAGVRI